MCFDEYIDGLKMIVKSMDILNKIVIPDNGGCKTMVAWQKTNIR